MTQITIVDAVRKTGFSRSYINKLVDGGRLSSTTNLEGVKVVEESELFRLCPPKPKKNDLQNVAINAAVLEAKLEAEKNKNILLEKQNEELKKDKERLIVEADDWKKQVKLLTYTKKSWWKKLFSNQS
jgi:DNA-binding transcriptional MerR regulator